MIPDTGGHGDAKMAKIAERGTHFRKILGVKANRQPGCQPIGQRQKTRENGPTTEGDRKNSLNQVRTPMLGSIFGEKRTNYRKNSKIAKIAVRGTHFRKVSSENS